MQLQSILTGSNSVKHFTSQPLVSFHGALHASYFQDAFWAASAFITRLVRHLHFDHLQILKSHPPNQAVQPLGISRLGDFQHDQRVLTHPVLLHLLVLSSRTPCTPGSRSAHTQGLYRCCIASACSPHCLSADSGCRCGRPRWDWREGCMPPKLCCPSAMVVAVSEPCMAPLSSCVLL